MQGRPARSIVAAKRERRNGGVCALGSWQLGEIYGWSGHCDPIPPGPGVWCEILSSHVQAFIKRVIPEEVACVE